MRGWVFVVLAMVVFGLGLGGIPESRAGGGLDQAMQNTFGAMVNTTNPGYAHNATRGVLTGGEFVVKNRIMNASLVNLQLPSISAGCGGWDAFGGSFSFISSAQIVAMLRSIASNAISYAFMLAIKAISQDMGNILQDMEDAMNMLNNSNINSCKVGMGLVNMFMGDSQKDQADLAAAQYSADTGQSSDRLAGSNQGQAQSSAAQMSNVSQAAHDAVIQGNVMWTALGMQSADSWFPGGNTTFREHVLSLTGAIVTCVPGSASDTGCHQDQPTDPSAQQAPITYAKPRIMSFDNLVEGSTEGNSVHVYHCNETTQCLDPTATDDATFVGMKTVLVQLLLQGTCSDAFTPGCGLVGRYAHLTGTMTAQDMQLRAALGDPLTAILNLSRIDENAARINVELLAPKMASDIAYKTALEALLTSASAVSSYKGGDRKTSELITQSLDLLGREREAYEKAHEINLNQIAFLDHLSNNISKARVNFLPKASQ